MITSASDWLKCKVCGAAEGVWCDPDVAGICVHRNLSLSAKARKVLDQTPFQVSGLTKEDKAWIIEQSLVYSKWLIEGRDLAAPTGDIEAFLAKARALVISAVEREELV
jgi:hypothetical protein